MLNLSFVKKKKKMRYFYLLKQNYKQTIILIFMIQMITVVWYLNKEDVNKVDCQHQFEINQNQFLTLYPATKWWKSEEKLNERIKMITDNFFPSNESFDDEQKFEFQVDSKIFSTFFYLFSKKK